MSEIIKHIVFYSGGVGSYCAAKRVCEKHDTSTVELLFTDTAMEHPTLYDFLNKSSLKLGAKLNILKDGRTPFDVFNDVKMMGNTRIDPCSRVLKREIANRYIKTHQPQFVCLYFGIDWTESHRADNIRSHRKPYTVEFPMLDKPYLTKQEMIKIAKDDGMPEQHLYSIGLQHNNCGGFCIKAGQGHYSTLLRNDPCAYKKFEEQELGVYKKNPKSRPFLRITINGKLNYVTLQKYREMIEDGYQPDLFDHGGCGCFLTE